MLVLNTPCAKVSIHCCYQWHKASLLTELNWLKLWVPILSQQVSLSANKIQLKKSVAPSLVAQLSMQTEEYNTVEERTCQWQHSAVDNAHLTDDPSLPLPGLKDPALPRGVWVFINQLRSGHCTYLYLYLLMMSQLASQL